MDFWATVFASLIGTVAGAVIALAGSWWLERRARKERESVRLVESIAAAVTTAFEEARQANSGDKRSAFELMRIGLDTGAALGAIRLVVKNDDDRTTIKAIQQAHGVVLQLPRSYARHNLLERIASVLGYWGSGEWSHVKVRAESSKIVADFSPGGVEWPADA